MASSDAAMEASTTVSRAEWGIMKTVNTTMVDITKIGSRSKTRTFEREPMMVLVLASAQRSPSIRSLENAANEPAQRYETLTAAAPRSEPKGVSPPMALC